MQTVNHLGVLGEIKEFNPENMALALQDPNVNHVQVFDGTSEALAERQKMVGKKFSVGKKFQKTGGNKRK
jgi:hypothetical protein